MAKVVLSVGMELKGYIQDFDENLQGALDKWKQQLSALNDVIINRIRIRLGDGTSIDPNQYEQELAMPATEGYKEFVGINAGNQHPSAILGQFKHELRVKGGVFKYINNVENAFQVNAQTGKSYFQDRVEAAYNSGMIKKIFAALQVVGARYIQKTFVPGVVMAMTGDGRYKYLLKQGLVTGENVAGYKVFRWDSTQNAYVAGTLDDFLNLLPAFEPHHAPYVRPYAISAIVQRFHLAVAADNVYDLGVITQTDYESYMKTINTPFANLATYKASTVSDVVIAYIDPLDGTFKPVDNWSDRRNKAALAFCVATESDDCSDLRNKWHP